MNVVDALDDALIAVRFTPEASARPGLQLRTVSGVEVRTKSDVLGLRPGWHKRVRLKLGDQESKYVKVTDDAKESATRWLQALAGAGNIRCVCLCPVLHVTCADAFANGSTITCGGWLSLAQAPSECD